MNMLAPFSTDDLRFYIVSDGFARGAFATAGALREWLRPAFPECTCMGYRIYRKEKDGSFRDMGQVKEYGTALDSLRQFHQLMHDGEPT